MRRNFSVRLVWPAAALLALLLAGAAGATTTYCVNTTAELRNAILDAAEIDDTVYIKVQRGSYPLTGAIRYSALFARELQIIGGYDSLCYTRTNDPAATEISFLSPDLAAAANVDLEFQVRYRLVLKSLTFRSIDDIHVILRGTASSVRVEANRFLQTGGLSIDANDFGASGTFSMDALLSSFHPAFLTMIEVYDNVVLNTPYEDGVWIRTGQSGTVRYRYNTVNHSEGYNLRIENGARANAVRVSSNIFYGDSVSDVFFNGNDYWTFERNLYRRAIYCPTDSAFDICFWEDPALNFLNADPKLDANGKPLSGSAAFNNGEDTSLPVGLFYDILGTARLKGSRTDLGAYEIQ